MKFPVSACPQALPVEAGISSYTTDFFVVDFRCRRFDGVYPAVDTSTPLSVTAGRAQHDSGGTQSDFKASAKNRMTPALRIVRCALSVVR